MSAEEEEKNARFDICIDLLNKAIYYFIAN